MSLELSILNSGSDNTKATRRPPPARTTQLPPVPPPCDHTTCGVSCYPQSRFPNWTPSQVGRSGIAAAITNYDKTKPCAIYLVDVDKNGKFGTPDNHEMYINDDNDQELWNFLVYEPQPPDVRVRAFFIDDITGNVLKMFGARYNIEPFFWSSSLKWIPSRFQENPLVGKGDHVTITLTFVVPDENKPDEDTGPTNPNEGISTPDVADSVIQGNIINTLEPLVLQSDNSGQNERLVLDVLCVHLIRDVNGSTLIFFNPQKDGITSGQYMEQRIRFAGRSVYWQNIFRKSPEPSFVLLTFLWHCLYAWDESLEALYRYICDLETRVISTSDMQLTHELHSIRAHHLHYAGLLEDFRKAVVFVRDTRNPAMDADADVKHSRRLLEQECYNLLSEIERLEMGRRMQDKRLKNVMNLVFSSVNIQDSKRMQKMTEAAVRDSAGKFLSSSHFLNMTMKQIAYLTMIFLPASFVAMNVKEIDDGTSGKLWQYVATAIPMTIVTIYAVIAFQSEHYNLRGYSVWSRMVWPYLMISNFMKNKEEEQGDSPEPDRNTLPLTNTKL
ncbi:hypothetical protein DL96DRAFT_1596644 [Flagelloscypha sp. PMI_526]|nr:hypothetical protein DL96DRAFT_1596644 [Flagelloscypha sp. PMI_526]